MTSSYKDDFLKLYKINKNFAEKQNIIIPVDPTLAKKLLATNIDYNRNISRARIKQYAEDMHANKWLLNGETIKIDQNGNVIDGQHRLHAIVESGKQIQMEFAFDINEGTITTIDTGKARTGTDVLKMHGAENASVLNSALKAVITYELGFDIGTSTAEISNLKRGSAYSNIITNDMVKDAYIRHPDIIYFIPKKSEIKSYGNRPLITALHYLFYIASQMHIHDFIHTMFSGYYSSDYEETKINKNVVLLSKELSAIYANRFNKKISTRTIAAMFIKVWNANINSKEIKKLFVTSKDFNQKILNEHGQPLILKRGKFYGRYNKN